MSDKADTSPEHKSLAEMFESVEASKNPELQLLELMIERARQMDEKLGPAIRFCAIPRRFDADIIGALRDEPDDHRRNELLLKSLRTYDFVQERKGEGYVYHESTRGLLLTDWQTDEKKRGQFDEYNGRLVVHYEARHREAQRAEEALGEVAQVIRAANESRNYQLVAIIERLVVSPLIEAIYHETLRSAEAGFRLFRRYYERYEMISRLTVCESLLHVTREYLRHLPPNGGQDVWLRWLDYYEGRLTRAFRRCQEAERLFKELLPETEDDTKLKLWTLSDLGLALHAQFKLRDAQEAYLTELKLAEETRQDPFNLPTSYSRVAHLHWTLDELDAAVHRFREAIQSAVKENNRGVLPFLRASLSGVLYERGDWDEAFDCALSALHEARKELIDKPAVHKLVASRFMFLLAKRNPRLLDTCYAEAKALLAEMADPIETLTLRNDYVNLLKEGGQLTRSTSEREDLQQQAAGHAATSFFATLLLDKSRMCDDLGMLDEAISICDEIVGRAQNGLANSWMYSAALSNRGIYNQGLANWSRARHDLEAAIKAWKAMGHKRLVAYLQVAWAELSRQQGRMRKAQALLDEARETILSNVSTYVPDYHKIQGNLYRDQGRWREAQEEYQEAVRISLSMDLHKKAAKCLTELAKIAADQGNWGEAARHTERAHKLWQLLAKATSYQPEESAIKADGENANAMQLLCRPGNDRHDRVVQARDMFHSASERVPSNIWYLLNLMYASAELEEWDSAAQTVESILDRGPEWIRSQFFQDRLVEYRSKSAKEVGLFDRVKGWLEKRM